MRTAASASSRNGASPASDAADARGVGHRAQLRGREGGHFADAVPALHGAVQQIQALDLRLGVKPVLARGALRFDRG